MKWWIAMLAVSGAAVLLSQNNIQAVDDEDAKLAAFFKSYLDEHFKLQPLAASRNGDHRFDDVLEDVTPSARKAWDEQTRKTLDELDKKIDYKKLSRNGQIDFEILKHSLNYSLWKSENTKSFEEDPLIYNSYITDCTYELLARSTLPMASNVKNCTARMAFIPKIVAAAKENLKNPPRIYAETAILRNRGAISFYESGIFDLAGETKQLSEMATPASMVVAILKEYQKFLEDNLLPRAKGEWRLGREKFAKKLVLELDAGFTLDQVVNEAEKEFERVEREMYVVARQLWSQAFPKKPLPPDDADGRRATIELVLAHYAKDHGKVENLLADTKATVDRVKAFIAANDILRLPDPDHCKIIEMPEFQRGFSVAYLNSAPPLDPKASSYYAVSPPPREWDARRVQTYLEEYNAHMLQILTIHEGYPGHYVQLEYANRCPSLIRKVLSSGVFEEGWAVYTEQTMLDQGYGKGDLALRLHQLKFYLRAVANAILDYKMHCTDYSDKEALEFLTKRVFQTEAEAVGKVIRAKLSSCQLSTYFVGRTAFYQLRQKIEREQGDQFHLGRYHEAVLDHGSLPVKYLPEVVPERLKKPR
jgi:uncharacterized protein (DUF885 family)